MGAGVAAASTWDGQGGADAATASTSGLPWGWAPAQGAYSGGSCKMSKVVLPLKILRLRQIIRVSGELCLFYFVEFPFNFL
jgi:hypothetical protein